MENRIYNRKTFVASQQDGRVYCSRCGRIIGLDRYTRITHAEKCGFSKDDFATRIYKENHTFAYGIRSDVDKRQVNFYVFTPILQLRKGFKDRFEGAKWQIVYRCVLFLDERRVEERGLQNIRYWIGQLDRMDTLNESEELEQMLCEVANIPALESVAMWMQIALGRGYQENHLLKQEEAEELLHRKLPILEGECLSLLGYVVKGKVLYSKVTKIPVLRVDVLYKQSVYRLLVASNFLYFKGVFPLKEVFSGKLIKCLVSKEEIILFDQHYPSFHLLEYTEAGGYNIMIALLSEKFNYHLEMISKAGLGSMAEEFFRSEEIAKRIMENNGNNLKEIFGLNTKLLRKMNRETFHMKNVFQILQEVSKYDPEFLTSVERITGSLVSFLKENVLAEYAGRRSGIDNWVNISRVKRLKMAKYMSMYAYDVYMIYRDYLNIRDKMIGGTSYSLFPNNLHEAHDEVLMDYEKIVDVKDAALFQTRISAEGYAGRATDYGEEAELFEKERYLICVPKVQQELKKEGSILHHCVGSYIHRVLYGTSQIFFLRQKHEKDKPFVTIEVVGNRVLQVKAFCNHRPTKDVQLFVRKWARVKQLEIMSSDMD